MTKALFKIIPFLPTRSSNTPSNDEAMHLELNQIITTLENPGIVTQLARLPSFGVSLRAALSAMTFDLNSGNGLRDIYYFIDSQENIDQAFFEHCVPVLEIAAKVSNSVEDVLEILGELVCIIRDFPSDLIPFIIVNFEHLVKNLVNKQEREGFLKEISTIWNFTPDVHALSYLEVPRLLWKMHTTVDSLVRRSELTDRMQAVLRKADGKVNMYSAMHEPAIFFQSPNRSLFTKRTACCELEWLVVHSSHLSSRDTDVIFYLNSHSFQFVVSVSQRIKSCIFPESGFPVTWEEGIKEPQTKERLRLARFLGEFINILKLRKSEDATVADIRKVVVSACDELCKAYENENREKSDLYKIHRQKLEDLFTEAFGPQSRLGDEVDCASMEHQTAERGCKGVLSVATQSVSLHEDQPRILSRNEIYEPLLVLLRRWLSTIVLKPVLGSRTLEIVRLLSSVHSSKKSRHFLEELHGIIQARLLSFKESQGLIAQLQAVGYNQNEKGTRDLWYSPTVDCAGYLSKRVSWCNRSFRKKLSEVLRSDWEEWKNILSILGIASIKVGDVIVCTRDLFGLQASLEEMEDQVSAVKKAVNQMIEPDDSNDIGRRVNEFMLQEKQHRARIEKLFLGKKFCRVQTQVSARRTK